MYTVKLPYDIADEPHEALSKFTDSAFNPRKSGFVVLLDGMNGEYIIAGNVIASTDECMAFEKPIKIVQPDKEELELLKREIKQLIQADPPEIKHWVVSHYR